VHRSGTGPVWKTVRTLQRVRGSRPPPSATWRASRVGPGAALKAEGTARCGVRLLCSLPHFMPSATFQAAAHRSGRPTLSSAATSARS